MKKQVELIAMHRIVNELDRRTAAIARKYGLTLPQFAVLEALYHKGDLSVGELKERCAPKILDILIRLLIET